MLKQAALAPAGEALGETALALMVGPEELSAQRLAGWGQCSWLQPAAQL